MGAMLGRKLAGILLACEAASFAVEELFTDQATIDKMYSAVSGEGRDEIAGELLLPAIQRITDRIMLEEGDIEVRQSYPDTYIENNGCHRTVQMLDTSAVGKLVKTTIMNFGAGSPGVWQGAPVFADAVFDAQVNISTRVRLSLGRKVFHHHCTQIGRKTVGLDLGSHGRVGLAVTLSITDTNIEKVNGSWAMAFTFSPSVVGTLLNWELDEVSASRCYAFRILDHEIGSICGTIEQEVMKRKEEFINRVRKLQNSPRIQAKLERAVKAKIGSRVVVPLAVVASAEGGGLSLAKTAAKDLDVAGVSAGVADAVGIAGAVPQAPAGLDMAGVARGAEAAYNLLYS